MVREKATITLDRAKVRDAMLLVEVHTMSEVVDIALERLIKAERLRRDVAAYGSARLTDEEFAFADMTVTFDLGDAAVDYESDYRLEE